MERLEYHLLEEREEISVLFTYPSISRSEILMRFACDYLVKGKDVFERVLVQADPPVHKIFVRRNLEETVLDDRLRFGPQWEGIRIESRHFHEEWSHYPVIYRYHFHDPQDALLHLLNGIQKILYSALWILGIQKILYSALWILMRKMRGQPVI
ncbi:hypothetical protein [Thermoactinomyces mirandus]|uniref:Uncharacterized protein n=1 Tax=Thermoactinomyces mirandus TaxID=2756294 RepID=A0A7W1XV15_9BACL|nr:hypothetical protein [Thermoactinomyces mirandus]MBA4603505.1 hypothetical protein [Thermoactinomyces mirandus]